MKKLLTIISVVGLGVLAACGSDDNTSSDSAVVSEAPGGQSEASTPPPDAASDGPVSVTQSGFSTFEAAGEIRADVAALIQNNTDEDFVDVEVTYDFIGADGTSVATESSKIDFLPAGEAVANSTGPMIDLTEFMPVTVEVSALSDADAGFGFEWAELDVTVADPTVVVDKDMGSGSFSGTIVNTSDATVADFYQVTCLVLDADGSVIGGINGYGETIEPGQTATWNASGLYDFEPFTEANGSVSNCRSFIVVD